MNRAEFTAGLAAIPLAQLSPAPGWIPFEGGRSLLRSFSSAPFPHSSRAAGHVYHQKLYDAATHYSDSTVGLYVPPGFVKKTSVDFVVHFHGWNNEVANVLTHYRLREQFAHSNVNAILVVPQGPKNAPDSGDGKLELDQNGLLRFITELTGFLEQAEITQAGASAGNIVLSAHSGGYGGLTGALIRGGLNDRISDVMMFDAMYANIEAVANWANLSSDKHLISVYTDYTLEANGALTGMLHDFAPAKTVGKDRPVGLAQIESRKPTFLYTSDVPHDEIMQKYNWFELFLQTTALRPR